MIWWSSWRRKTTVSETQISKIAFYTLFRNLYFSFPNGFDANAGACGVPMEVVGAYYADQVNKTARKQTISGQIAFISVDHSAQKGKY
jgi:hypothetical protein